MVYCSMRWLFRCTTNCNRKEFSIVDYETRYSMQELYEDMEACRQAGHRVVLFSDNGKILCSGIPHSRSLKCWFNSQNKLFSNVQSIV